MIKLQANLVHRHVKGRGLTVSVDKQDYPGVKFVPGKYVVQDDKQYVIRGVEKAAGMRGSPNPNIILQIEEVPSDSYYHEITTPSPGMINIEPDRFVHRFYELWEQNRLYAERFKEQCRIIEEKRDENMALRKELKESRADEDIEVGEE